MLAGRPLPRRSRFFLMDAVSHCGLLVNQTLRNDLLTFPWLTGGSEFVFHLFLDFFRDVLLLDIFQGAPRASCFLFVISWLGISVVFLSYCSIWGQAGFHVFFSFTFEISTLKLLFVSYVFDCLQRLNLTKKIKREKKSGRANSHVQGKIFWIRFWTNEKSMFPNQKMWAINDSSFKSHAAASLCKYH